MQIDKEKEIFLKNFDLKDYNQKLLSSVPDFELKMKGLCPVEESELRKMIDYQVDIRFLDVSKIEYMITMFKRSMYKVIDLSRWDMKNVTQTDQMFFSCPNLVTLNLTNFKAESLIEMDYMINNCPKLENLIMPDFIGEKVAISVAVFGDCPKLKEIDLPNSKISCKEYEDSLFDSKRELKKINYSGKILDFDERICTFSFQEIESYKIHNFFDFKNELKREKVIDRTILELNFKDNFSILDKLSKKYETIEICKLGTSISVLREQNGSCYILAEKEFNDFISL
tara:strand:+ start:23139 stop:23990 length:852 start_codon:yes stop_codon:yes gene_type:complete